MEFYTESMYSPFAKGSLFSPAKKETESMPLLFAAVTPLYKGEAVCTFRNGRVLLMCADCNTVQAAIVFCTHIVLALGNGTTDVIIFLHFHDAFPHFSLYLFQREQGYYNR